MKKVLLLNLNALRKVAIMAFFCIMLLSLFSCATIIDSLLGNSTCIAPGCDNNTSGHSSYCIIHSDREPVEVDTTNPYKLHKPLSEEEMMKTKVNIKKKN